MPRIGVPATRYVVGLTVSVAASTPCRLRSTGGCANDRPWTVGNVVGTCPSPGAEAATPAPAAIATTARASSARRPVDAWAT